jgi:hypothetical protein
MGSRSSNMLFLKGILHQSASKQRDVEDTFPTVTGETLSYLRGSMTRFRRRASMCLYSELGVQLSPAVNAAVGS